MQMAFYIANTEQWLDDVIDACNRSNLNPEDSIFMLVTFSSLDEQFLTFFRNKNAQISQFSGQNFHVFSPIVYRNVVDDQDWRSFRENITHAGIPVSNKPTALFFRLTKRPVASGYEPQFFAGFECPAFSKFRALLKDVVETGIAHAEGHADPYEAARGPVHGAEPGQSTGSRRLISIGGRKTHGATFLHQLLSCGQEIRL